jgi:predicted AAA+ superfamily ATPase
LKTLGRLVESCAGAHLVNSSFGTNISVTYWRERNHEVDFVLQLGKTVAAIEVKSGRRREALPGMEAFAKAFKPKRQLQVGGHGIALEEFLLKPAAHWLQ